MLLTPLSKQTTTKALSHCEVGYMDCKTPSDSIKEQILKEIGLICLSI